MLRLVTIPFSHYCERARWALDLGGLEYEEDPHFPAFHARAVRRAGGRETTPALVTPDGTLPESGDIVRWVDRQHPELGLYPDEHAAQIERLEHRFAEDLGPATRRWLYGHVLPKPLSLLRWFGPMVPRWQRAVFFAMSPVVGTVMGMRMGISAQTMRTDLDLTRRILDEVADRLSDGRPYLCGDSFTAADLTFATMAVPVVGPPQYGVALPDLESDPDIPDAMKAVVRTCRSEPSGGFALRMFAEHRRPVTA